MTEKETRPPRVTIKGTRDGLTFILDDQCSYNELLTELHEKLSEEQYRLDHGPLVHVKLFLGKRYLDDQQIADLKEQISERKNIVIDDIRSDVITVEEAENRRKDSRVTRLAKIVRSGQVIEIRGDLLLLGDVNPGGTVRATGNIFILGALRGIAQAGISGDDRSIICAATMQPSQLRIADILRRAPEKGEKVEEERFEDLECAYVNGQFEMVLDQLQRVAKLRPELNDEWNVRTVDM
ncbi:septum site-determining protein MinC [Texcoconibacillus texcoconensis]|uniref:Probable septum site-determining protein MinC n=1 Tax=Texcoconibacillus texcoconensis TaxID=1095777 RepID=A0A840QSP2_9BACI|nr:septum site-determining protein MinC [Texcoconibacillus texcoconensis]MBB5174384.1 septum site-determining protein MinC [Texcoconibacillus texcoconensis]